MTESITKYPIFKNYDESQIVTNVGNRFRKGEKPLFWALTVLVLGGLGVAFVMFALAPMMKIIGITLGALVSAMAAIGVVISYPAWSKWMKVLTRQARNAAIRHDPFGELKLHRDKIQKQKEELKKATGTIQVMADGLQRESIMAEKEAQKCQTDLVDLRTTVNSLNQTRMKIQEANPNDFASDDQFNMISRKLLQHGGNMTRLQSKLEQSKSLVVKYGSASVTMKKLTHKLHLAIILAENKELDFDATIEMLFKESRFAEQSRRATSAARKALHIDLDPEMVYAINVINATIEMDYSITNANLIDLDRLTSKIDYTDEQVIMKLDSIADKIISGQDLIPQSKRYNNPNLILTAEERAETKLPNLF